jgi:hypothetical protein
MWKRNLISIVIFLGFTVVIIAQVNPKDEELRLTVSRYGQAEVTIPYPGREKTSAISRKISVSSVRDKEVFITISPVTLNWFISQGFNYTLLEYKGHEGITTAANLKEAMAWETYPSWSQYLSVLQYFQTTYPSLCRVDTIGTSIMGRLVLALKISDNVNVNETEPEVFYSSTMHGDELGGYVLMLRLADYLLSEYGIDPLAKSLVDNLEIWINPLANPDGTYTVGDTISYPTRSNSNGIDLNRNFPDPLDPNIVQEKETIDMMRFMRKHKFVLSANFHSGVEVVNYPWDRWLSRYHADNDWFYSISRAYADTVHNYSGPSYMSYLDNGVTRGAEWYIIYGGRQDFITWELQGREVTVELDFTKQTPAAQLELLWQYNKHSLLRYLENALFGIHGRVLDSETGLPIPARVFIVGHDVDSSHVSCDTLTGMFTRYIEPGSWDIKFSATGYKDTIISNVTVNDRERTDLVVEMNSFYSSVEKSDDVVPVIFPNPAGSVIKCIFPDSIFGRINIKIYNQSGMLFYNYNTEVYPGEVFEIDLKKSGAGIYYILFTNKEKGIACHKRIVVTGSN